MSAIEKAVQVHTERSAPPAPADAASANAAPLVRATDLAKTFDVSAPWLNRVLERQPRQLLRAVDGVSFDIARGQTLALVGESGCGKSTVARLLVGLYETTRGGFEFDGQDAHAAFKTPQGRQLRRRIQMIFQDPYASLNPRWIVQDIIAEPLREHSIETDPEALSARVDDLLRSVGLSPQDRVKYPHQFSGGQRQRIALARALYGAPFLVVLDEPNSNLDAEGEAALTRAIRGVRERGGIVVVIAHRPGVLAAVDMVGIMDGGQLKAFGPRDEILRRATNQEQTAAVADTGPREPAAAPPPRRKREHVRPVVSS